MNRLFRIGATLAVLAVVLGLALTAAGAARRVVARQQEGEPPVDTLSAGASRESAAPLGVFADFEKAWMEGNVAAILEHFGKQKVAISVDGTGPSGGEFSRSQSYYLLKDLFKYTTTHRFEFVQFRKLDNDGRTTFAVAERHYQKSDDGRLFEDKIYVSLHIEGKQGQERWVIDEIKSIR